MTANASPAVLAPVDVDKVLAVIDRHIRDLTFDLRNHLADLQDATLREGQQRMIDAAKKARAAVEKMAADLAAARERLQTFMDRTARAEQRAEAAEADAARWHYVKPWARSQPKMSGQHHWYFAARGNLIGNTLEGAVDAAIAQQEPRPHGG